MTKAAKPKKSLVGPLRTALNLNNNVVVWGAPPTQRYNFGQFVTEEGMGSD